MQRDMDFSALRFKKCEQFAYGTIRFPPDTSPNMSGISGIWNLDGKPLSRELLERVAQCLQHRGPDGTASWQKGSVGLSSSLLRVTPESKDEVQPVVHSSGCVLVFDGRLDNRSELIEELRENHIAHAATPDSLLALLAY